jgi:spore coat polysaccharide biosynthesis protein SpsF (cytidylyltransferase family)
MMEVLGRPLLGYLVERLRSSKYLDDIIIATTRNREDDIIVDYARKKNLFFFRGSENDVLSRFYKTAIEFGVEHVVRVTSDCPLVDPALIDRVIMTYLNGGFDYVHLSPAFAEGLDTEVFSFKALEVAHKNAKLQSEREHVTLYLNNNLDLFNKFVIENETDDSTYRFTVDEPEDFEVVKAIFEALYERDALPFSFEVVKNFLDAHPEIAQKNAHIIRNEGLLISLQNDAEMGADNGPTR